MTTEPEAPCHDAPPAADAHERQTLALERIAALLEADREQRDRVEDGFDDYITREGDMLERIAVSIEALVAHFAPPEVRPPFYDRPAPQPDADGWIEWYGGECPVPPTTRVQFRTQWELDHPGGHISEEADGRPAHSLRWTHKGDVYSDIVRYRVIR